MQRFTVCQMLYSNSQLICFSSPWGKQTESQWGSRTRQGSQSLSFLKDKEHMSWQLWKKPDANPVPDRNPASFAVYHAAQLMLASAPEFLSLTLLPWALFWWGRDERDSKLGWIEGSDIASDECVWAGMHPSLGGLKRIQFGGLL